MSLVKKVNIFLIILVFQVIVYVKSQSMQNTDLIDSASQLPACSDFDDLQGTPLNQQNRYIKIPANRTNLIVRNPKARNQSFEFLLKQNRKLKCDEGKFKFRTLSWNLEDELGELPLRNYNNIDNVINGTHQHSYFTTAGYFYDSITKGYYNPDGDYCVKSHSIEDITLKVCVIGSDDCSNAARPNTWCIPKCCAIDEHLLYFAKRCTTVQGTDGQSLGTTPWLPEIFKGPENPHHLLEKKVGQKGPTNSIFKMNQLPRNCNIKSVEDIKTANAFVKWYTAAYTEHPKYENKTEKNSHIKLAAPAEGKSGTVRPLILSPRSRTWKLIENIGFCVDGFFVRNKLGPKFYAGKHNDFVIYYCEETKDARVENYVVNTWLYAVISIIALPFLLATILVYVVLWEKQNLHGMTILSYTTATFFAYLFLTVAHMISLEPNGHITDEREPFCYGNAVLAHYFFLSSYLWLTVMNLDLWLTFKSVRAVRRDSKEWPKYGWYSLVAWVFPLLLVIVFIIIDHVYRDPVTEVKVPDYASETCFVSEYFRGQYVFTPMAILLGLNIVLICLTMKIFIDARTQTSQTLSGSAANASQYSAPLFAKLFIVMGGASLVDFVTWYYNDKGSKHWAIAVVESITYLVPIALFALFCLNTRVVNQMRDKYPKLMETMEPVLRCFKKSEDAHTVGSKGEQSTSFTATKVETR